MGFRHAGQTGLELLTSCDPPALASQSAGITVVSHCAWPKVKYSKNCLHFSWRKSIIDGHLGWFQVFAIVNNAAINILVTGFCHVGQAGLDLLTSGDLPASAFQSAGITGVRHHARPNVFYNKIGHCGFSMWDRGQMRSHCVAQAGVHNAITAHCSLGLLDSTGITGADHDTWLIFVLFVQTWFRSVIQDGLKLLSSSDYPASASQSARITNMESHCDIQSGVQWHNLCSLQTPPSGFKPFSRLSLLIEIRFCHVGQTGLELLTSGDAPALASQSAGITDVSHYAQPRGLTFVTACIFWLIQWTRYLAMVLTQLYHSESILGSGWAQWFMPVIPALWKAEVGGSHETRNWRAAWANGGLASCFDLGQKNYQDFRYGVHMGGLRENLENVDLAGCTFENMLSSSI
ncbi:Histone demethylase UTY [Plecturocebus cupreus]